MHILQPKHSKLSEQDSKKLLMKLNISESQLPKIFSDDFALPEGCSVGDIIEVERKDLEGNSASYYRVVV